MTFYFWLGDPTVLWLFSESSQYDACRERLELRMKRMRPVYVDYGMIRTMVASIQDRMLLLSVRQTAEFAAVDRGRLRQMVSPRWTSLVSLGNSSTGIYMQWPVHREQVSLFFRTDYNYDYNKSFYSILIATCLGISNFRSASSIWPRNFYIKLWWISPMTTHPRTTWYVRARPMMISPQRADPSPATLLSWSHRSHRTCWRLTIGKRKAIVSIRHGLQSWHAERGFISLLFIPEFIKVDL